MAGSEGPPARANLDRRHHEGLRAVRRTTHVLEHQHDEHQEVVQQDRQLKGQQVEPVAEEHHKVADEIVRNQERGQGHIPEEAQEEVIARHIQEAEGPHTVADETVRDREPDQR